MRPRLNIDIITIANAWHSFHYSSTLLFVRSLFCLVFISFIHFRFFSIVICTLSRFFLSFGLMCLLHTHAVSVALIIYRQWSSYTSKQEKRRASLCSALITTHIIFYCVSRLYMCVYIEWHHERLQQVQMVVVLIIRSLYSFFFWKERKSCLILCVCMFESFLC